MSLWTTFNYLRGKVVIRCTIKLTFSTFCPFRRFVFRRFVPFDVLSFDVLSFDVLSVYRKHSYTTYLCLSWDSLYKERLLQAGTHHFTSSLNPTTVFPSSDPISGIGKSFFLNWKLIFLILYLIIFNIKMYH